MKAFQSIDDILDFAIGNEVDSFIFYTDLANTMKNQNLREMFLGFAQEEKKHKGKLLQAKKDKILLPAQDKITEC
jgi:rubrerythrin